MAAPTRVSSTASAFGSSTSPKTASGIAVQAGDVIVVRGINENGAETFNTPTSTGLTFTARPNVGTSGSTGRCAAWTAPIASSGTISVSLTTAGTTSNWFGVVVSVWRNHGGIGATASVNNTAGTGAPTFNITTTGANSGIDWCTSDFNAIDGTSRVYRSVNGAAALEDSYFRDSVHYAAYAAYHPDAGAIGTYAVGESAPAGQKYAGVAVEILAGAGGGTTFTTTISASTTGAASVQRQVGKTLAVASTGAAQLVRAAAVTLKATSTGAALVVRVPAVTVKATSTAVAQLVRRPAVTLAAASTAAASVVPSRVRLLTLTAASTAAATVAGVRNRVLTVVASTVAAVVLGRAVRVSLLGTTTGQASITTPATPTTRPGQLPTLGAG